MKPEIVVGGLYETRPTRKKRWHRRVVLAAIRQDTKGRRTFLITLPAVENHPEHHLEHRWREYRSHATWLNKRLA